MRIYFLLAAVHSRWFKDGENATDNEWNLNKIASRFRIYCVRIIIRLLPLRIKLQSRDIRIQIVALQNAIVNS